MDIFEIVRLFLSSSWDFLTELTYPGLDVSFAALAVGLFLAVLGLRLLFYLFGLGSGGDSPRTSSTSRPRISKERSRDEF